MDSLKVILFDLDDTLFDHTHASLTGLQILREKHTCLRTHHLEDLEREYRRLLDILHRDVLSGKITLETARVNRFRLLFAWCGHNITPGEARAVADEYHVAYLKSRRLVLGAPELLRALRRAGVVVGVVTNNLVREQRDKLHACGLDHLVNFLVTSEEVGQPKPAPLIFEVALRKAGCDPDQACVVGDSWSVDVLGAHAAGICFAVWLNRRGATCPDPTMAAEVRALEPVGRTLSLLGIACG